MTQNKKQQTKKQPKKQTRQAIDALKLRFSGMSKQQFNSWLNR